MNLLLEIGAEVEMFLTGCCRARSNTLAARSAELFKQNQLGGESIRTDATPRRLVVRAEGIAARQMDTEERVWGPAKSAPEAAVAGFAKKQGTGVEALEVLSDGKAEKYSYMRRISGRAAAGILAEAIPALVLKTPFPKTMYWREKNVRFIRPIRWIVALLDGQVIPFNIAGIPSGNESSGHRKLGAARFEVTYDNYEAKLRENFVILSAEERKERIRAVPTKYVSDDELLDTLVNLTEWPTPITGSFDESYLDLPKEVLSTVMRHHQKYFSVETEDGNLAPTFVAVTNTDGDPDGLIQRGNERVLRARFNDARFFWDADQKKSLEDRVYDLGNVTFQAKLGSYLDKTQRMDELSLTLLLYVGSGGQPIGEEALKQAKVRYAFEQTSLEYQTVRASRLSKADLTTELVKEVHRAAGRSRRTLCPGTGRSGRSRDCDLRALQAGEHGRLDSAQSCRAGCIDRG